MVISQTCYRYQAKQSADTVDLADLLIRLTQNQRNEEFGWCFRYLHKAKGNRWKHSSVYRSYRELKLNCRGHALALAAVLVTHNAKHFGPVG